jgi:hydrogenase maturation protease
VSQNAQFEVSLDHLPRILALGSPHGNDQAGWLIADLLSEREQLRGHCQKLAHPWDIVSAFREQSDVIIVDACKSGGAPGSIHWLPAAQLSDSPVTPTSSHGASVVDALQLADSLGYDISRAVVYAVEVDSTEPGESLALAVRRGACEIAELIAGELALRAENEDCNGATHA